MEIAQLSFTIEDYSNMAEVRKGIKSRGFKGTRPNPRLKIPGTNFSHALPEFLDKGYDS